MKNWNIGRRLGLGFFAVLALSTVVTAIGVLQIKSVSDMTGEMVRKSVVKERLASDWARYISAAVVRTTAIAKSDDPALASFFAKTAAESTAGTTEVVRQIESLLSSEEEKKLYAETIEVRKAYLRYRDDVTRLKAERKASEANELLEKSFMPAAERYQKKVADFLEIQRKSLNEKAAAIEAADRRSRIGLIVLGTVIILSGVVFAFVLTRGITRPLNEAVAVAETVASGDLRSRIEIASADETGQLMQALKNMNDSLLDIVSRVRSGTDMIAAASSQIASGNQDLSSRTEEQAGSLEETACSMEELTGTVRRNGDNANQANQLAISASAIALKGGEIVSEVVETMGEIESSAKKMADIVSVIDGIAFQTNILALNAAVEAARAGEQGRGFAVVASEVRSLAQRSAEAAREIKALIENSLSRVAAGAGLVDQAGKTMTEIVAAIQRVTDIMGEIASSTREQVNGIEQVNLAVTQMDTVTQQNAALVEEAAAAAESLQDQAGKLVDVVSVFRTGDRVGTA